MAQKNNTYRTRNQITKRNHSKSTLKPAIKKSKAGSKQKCYPCQYHWQKYNSIHQHAIKGPDLSSPPEHH